jgi:two-component sensor histidine kinase
LSSEQGDYRLRMRWEESGGPPVVDQPRQGFGTRLIERTLTQELDGEVKIEFAPTGVVCEFHVPLRDVASSTPHEHAA